MSCTLDKLMECVPRLRILAEKHLQKLTVWCFSSTSSSRPNTFSGSCYDVFLSEVATACQHLTGVCIKAHSSSHLTDTGLVALAQLGKLKRVKVSLWL